MSGTDANGGTAAARERVAIQTRVVQRHKRALAAIRQQLDRARMDLLRAMRAEFDACDHEWVGERLNGFDREFHCRHCGYDIGGPSLSDV